MAVPRVTEVPGAVVAKAATCHAPDIVDEAHLMVEVEASHHLTQVKCVDTMHVFDGVVHAVTACGGKRGREFCSDGTINRHRNRES